MLSGQRGPDYARINSTDATVSGSVRQTVGATDERWFSAELLDSIGMSDRRDARSTVMVRLDPQHGSTARRQCPGGTGPLRRESGRNPARRRHSCSPDALILGRAGSNFPPPLLLFDIRRAYPAASKGSVSDDNSFCAVHGSSHRKAAWVAICIEPGAASRPICEVAWRFFCSAALFISCTDRSPHTMPRTFAEPSMR